MELHAHGHRLSGVYWIDPTNMTKEEGEMSDYARRVHCQNGWTTILTRKQAGNPVDFFARDFEEYTQGFGNPGGEYWMGLEPLHR